MTPAFTINQLSIKTGADRRTIAKYVQGLTPAGQRGKANLYRLDEVQAALANKPSKTLKDEKLAEEIRKLRIRNNREEGHLVLRSAVDEAISRCLSPVASILEAKLCQEFPSVVAGLEPVQARVYGKRLADQILEQFQQLKKEWMI